jgi:hypothetical protein
MEKAIPRRSTGRFASVCSTGTGSWTPSTVLGMVAGVITMKRLTSFAAMQLREYHPHGVGPIPLTRQFQGDPMRYAMER